MISNILEIKKYLAKDFIKKIFLLTGQKSYKESGAKNIFDKILLNKNTVTYYKKEYIPKFQELKKIIISLEKFNPDLILAIGGGTVIDYAKIANCLSSNTTSDQIKSGALKLKKKSILCAIPTTAGSGAEVTENAVLYLDKIKFSVENKLIKPDKYFLIPEFVVESDKYLKASSGFDAIAQAIESFLSLKSNDQSANFSIKSLNYSLSNYEKFIKFPKYENASNMCLAANLSGKAISIARTTAPHAVSYPFTSLYNISHGHAVSLTLSNFLKFNYVNLSRSENRAILSKKYKILFNLTKTKSIDDFCSYMDFLKKSAGLESKLSNLKINLDSALEKIISGINIKRLKNNPIEINTLDIKKILNEIK